MESWQKFRKLENSVLDFLIKHYTVLLVVFATVLAVVVRWKFLSYESRDFTDFLLPWFTALKEGGGLSALATYSGDYNAPYVTILALLSYLPFSPLVLIKLVSIIFDFVLAGAVAYLVYTLVIDKQHKKGLAVLAYIMILFLPQVMLNGAFWGQCDAIYASFCVLALTFLLKERYALAFVFLGVAFAFKLQFIFILPIFIVVYVVKRKFSILNFFILPITIFQSHPPFHQATASPPVEILLVLSPPPLHLLSPPIFAPPVCNHPLQPHTSRPQKY